MAVDGLRLAEELVERSVHAGQRHRVGAIRAAVQHDVLGLHVHDVLAGAEGGRAGRAAADRLGDAGDVGDDAVALLGAAEGDTEAGDDLVEDEQHAVLVAEAAQTLEEARLGRDDAAVGEDRLAEDRGELVGVALDQRLDAFEVVEAAHDHGILDDLGDAGQRRQGARVLLRSRRLECGHVREGVAVKEAVVAPLPLEDLVLARVAARQAHRRLGGLGARVGEPDLVDARHGLHDLAPDLVVELMRERVEHAALGDLLDDGVDDELGPMTEEHRPVADAPVDVVVAVDVVEVGALALLHDDRTRTDEAGVARLAAGNHLLALGEPLLGLGQVGVVDQVVAHGFSNSFISGRARRGHAGAGPGPRQLAHSLRDGRVSRTALADDSSKLARRIANMRQWRLPKVPTRIPLRP